MRKSSSCIFKFLATVTAGPITDQDQADQHHGKHFRFRKFGHRSRRWCHHFVVIYRRQIGHAAHAQDGVAVVEVNGSRLGGATHQETERCGKCVSFHGHSLSMHRLTVGYVIRMTVGGVMRMIPA
jgi:hypothetical protein